MHPRHAAGVLRGSDNRPVRLSPRTINHSINLLSLILDEAVRRPGVALGANPARDRKLRAKVANARLRDWLEPDEVMTLLEAAEDVDHPVGLETLRKAEEVRRLRDQDGLTVRGGRRTAPDERGRRVLVV